MPHAARMTPISGVSLKRRWPYQASVMNTLEPSSKTTGSKYGDVSEKDMMLCLSKIGRDRAGMSNLP